MQQNLSDANTALSQSITAEGEARQGQIDAVNSQIDNTNAVVDAIHTTTFNGIFEGVTGADIIVPLSGFAPQTIAPGKTLIFDQNGSCAVSIDPMQSVPQNATGSINLRIKSIAQGAGLGAAQTVFFRDDIQVTPGMSVFTVDTGVVLKDGANYEVWVSAMSGNTGSTTTNGNGITLYMNDGNIMRPFSVLGNFNAILNAEWRFRWQMHLFASSPSNNVVNAFPRHGNGVILDFVYSSSAGIDVDFAGAARTTAQAASGIQRLSVPVSAVPTLAFGIASVPSCNITFMVKVIETRSAYPTN